MARRLQYRYATSSFNKKKKEREGKEGGLNSGYNAKNGSHTNYSHIEFMKDEEEVISKSEADFASIKDEENVQNESQESNNRVRRSHSCSDLNVPQFIIQNSPDSKIEKLNIAKFHSIGVSAEYSSSLPKFGILKSRNNSKIKSYPKKSVRFADLEEYQIKEEQNELLEKHISNVMNSYDELFYGTTNFLYESFLPPLPKLEKHNQPKNTAIITIAGEKGLLFKYVVFNVSVSAQLDPLSVDNFNISNVTRRYSDFLWLWQFLVKKYPNRQVPNIPKKRGLVLADSKKKFEPQFLEKRRDGLQSFLIELLYHPTFSKDSAVQVFIQCDEDSFQRSKDMLLKTMLIEKDIVVVHTSSTNKQV